VVEDGAFQAQNQCGPKLISTAPKSCAHIMLYPKTTRGLPLLIQPCFDPEKDSFNEQGLVDETSFHSINRRHEEFGHGDITVSPRYHDG
jgi:hypothetical protein